jgi:hypothetical protein
MLSLRFVLLLLVELSAVFIIVNVEQHVLTVMEHKRAQLLAALDKEHTNFLLHQDVLVKLSKNITLMDVNGTLVVK